MDLLGQGSLSIRGPAMDIRAADLPADLPIVRRLFRQYADSLGIDLEFQDFETELTSLPGKYSPPRGCLLLAWDGDRAVGCVALRSIDENVCEMKRLYVDPAIRARGLGRRLAERIIQEARVIGYRSMCLDTLSSMTSALRLYYDLGFRPIKPYVFNPIAGAIFLGLDL